MRREESIHTKLMAMYDVNERADGVEIGVQRRSRVARGVEGWLRKRGMNVERGVKAKTNRQRRTVHMHQVSLQLQASSDRPW